MAREKKITNNTVEQDQNPFALSTGDMMSVLMFIFILLLSAMMLQVQNQSERIEEDRKQDEESIKKYEALKDGLYNRLVEVFKEDTIKWNVSIRRDSMSVIFTNPDILFDYNSYSIKPAFKSILDEFYPAYMEVLYDSTYRDDIEEIRIEGHTDSRGGYISNMELSQNRTRAVLDYCLKIDSLAIYNDWSRSRITANGLSFSHLVYDENNEENPNLSRRVEFRVRTKAEKYLEKILKDRLERKDGTNP